MPKYLRDLGRAIVAVMVGGQLAQEVARETGEGGETTSNADLDTSCCFTLDLHIKIYIIHNNISKWYKDKIYGHSIARLVYFGGL